MIAYKLNSFTTSELIYGAVAINTIRAFHHDEQYIKYKPLSIYRYWAQSFLEDSRNKELIKNCSNFKKLHDIALADLKSFWETEDGTKLDFHLVAKLVDLTFKKIPCWTELSDEKQKWFMNEIYVPLDKYSLILLRKHSERYSEIPKNPSMGFIKNEDTYNEIQKEIKDICTICNIPPIAFDLLAWNETHKIDKNKKFKLLDYIKK